jgi:hypothetical protein
MSRAAPKIFSKYLQFAGEYFNFLQMERIWKALQKNVEFGANTKDFRLQIKSLTLRQKHRKPRNAVSGFFYVFHFPLKGQKTNFGTLLGHF